MRIDARRLRRGRRPTGPVAAAITVAALVGASSLVPFGARPALADEPSVDRLRVCADPNNLPFSNDAEQGFENRIAEILAADLGAELEYTWWAQRRGFLRSTLRAGACDLVIGTPAGGERIETTRPYYRSTYVFVQRDDIDPPVESMLDPRLRTLRIGVHLTGDDGTNPPPAHALGRLGIVDNVSGYLIYGDYREHDPPARLIEAVARRDVEVAAVWGPLGGYFAQRVSGEPLVVRPIVDTERFAGLPFEFAIAMGVREGETAFRDRIQAAIDRHADAIRRILIDYRVPLVTFREAANAEEANL